MKKFLIVANNFKEALNWFDDKKLEFLDKGEEIPEEWKNITSHYVFVTGWDLNKLRGIVPSNIYYTDDVSLRRSEWQTLEMVRDRMNG